MLVAPGSCGSCGSVRRVVGSVASREREARVADADAGRVRLGMDWNAPYSR